MSGLTRIIMAILAASYLAVPNEAEASLKQARVIAPVITYDGVLKPSKLDQNRKDARELMYHGDNFYRQGDYRAAINHYTKSFEVLAPIKVDGIPDFDVFRNVFYLGKYYFMAAANGAATSPAERERYCRNTISFLSMAKEIIELYSVEFGHSEAMAAFGGFIPYYDRYSAGSFEMMRDLVNYSRHLLKYYGTFPQDVDIGAFSRKIAAEANEKELSRIFELINKLEDKSVAAGLTESIQRYREIRERGEKTVGQ